MKFIMLGLLAPNCFKMLRLPAPSVKINIFITAQRPQRRPQGLPQGLPQKRPQMFQQWLPQKLQPNHQRHDFEQCAKVVSQMVRFMYDWNFFDPMYGVVHWELWREPLRKLVRELLRYLLRELVWCCFCVLPPSLLSKRKS